MVMWWMALASGCVWISDADHAARIDADNDGEQLYGYHGGLDCDDNDPAVGQPTAFFRDADGDGFGDESEPTEACTAPEGYVSIIGDCADDNVGVHPDAEEICSDGLDNNCDGQSCLPPGTYLDEDFSAIRIGNSAALGAQLDASGDHNGDGYSDVLSLAENETPPVILAFDGPFSRAEMVSATARITFDNPENQGALVIRWGDINNDGYSDMLVGCPDCPTDDGFERGGELYAWFGPREGDLERLDADLVVSGFEVNDQLGSSFGVVGDDFIVGIRGDGSNLYSHGAWYFFEGGLSRSTNTADMVATSGNTAWTLGEGPVLGADFTGSGVEWAVIPAKDRDGVGGLYLLEEPGLWRRYMEDDCVQLVSSGSVTQRFAEGYAVGDLNGDGEDDLAVGAPGASAVGVVYVYFSPQGEPFSFLGEDDARTSIVGVEADGELGSSIAIGPDLDGDGQAELAVGAPGAEGGGKVYVFSALDAGFVQASDAAWVLQSTDTNRRLGQVISAGLDLDGERYADLAVGLSWSSEILIVAGGSL